MKRIIFLLAFAMPIFQGCIEIKEEITINADGSGKILISLDLGMAAQALSQFGQNLDFSIIDTIRGIADNAQSLLSSCKGISEIVADKNDNNGYYAVGFNFKNTKALNKALYLLAGYKKTGLMPSFFKISRHKVIKKDIAPMLKKLMGKKDDNSEMSGNMMFQYIDYISEFHLPSPAKKISNPLATKEDGGRTIITTYNIAEMMKTDINFGITILY